VLIGPVGESALTHLSLLEPGSRLLEGMASPTVPTDGENPDTDRVSLKSQGKYFSIIASLLCMVLPTMSSPFPIGKLGT
jgi:hypothetical protein